MGRSPTITLSEPTPPASGALRRGLDLAVAGLALVLAAPLMAVIAAAVRLSSHGPVLHREAAVGPRGRTVELLSFRTMVDGGGTEAHARLRAVLGGGRALTPVGRRLERLRLARVPCLLNLLKGEASLFS